MTIFHDSVIGGCPSVQQGRQQGSHDVRQWDTEICEADSLSKWEEVHEETDDGGWGEESVQVHRVCLEAHLLCLLHHRASSLCPQ